MAPLTPQGMGHNNVEASADGMLTFKVELRRQAGERLGIDIVFLSSNQGCGLVVGHVSEGGVVDEWNRKVGGPFHVRAGDFIVCVNGIESNVQALGAELQSDRDITMTIQRTCAEGTPPNWREMQASMFRQQNGTTTPHQQVPPDLGGDFAGMSSNPNAECIAERLQHQQSQLPYSQQHSVQQPQQQIHHQQPSEQQQQMGLLMPGVQQEQCPPQRMSQRIAATMPSQQIFDAPGMGPGRLRGSGGQAGPGGPGRGPLNDLSMETTDLGNDATGRAESCLADTAYDPGGEAIQSLRSEGPGSHFTFQVVLVRPNGTRLGIDVLPVKVADLGALSVKAISKGGVVEQWNQKCLENYTIQIGDCLIRVNGVVTDTPEMMNELRTCHELHITVLRGFGSQQCSSQPRGQGRVGGMIPPGITPSPPPTGPALGGPLDGDWGGFPKRALQQSQGKVRSMLPAGVAPPPPPMGPAPSPPDVDWGPFPPRPEMGSGPPGGGPSPTAGMSLVGPGCRAPQHVASGPLSDNLSAMQIAPNPAIRRHPSVDMDVGQMPEPNFGCNAAVPIAGPPHRFASGPGGSGGSFHGEDHMVQTAAAAADSLPSVDRHVASRPPGPPGNDGNKPLTFDVEIEKEVGMRLGIDLMLLTTSGVNSFVVQHIAEGGCVDLWNQQSMPPYQVCPGDYIIQVNGFTVWDNFPRMAGELAPDCWQVCLTVQRLHANKGARKQFATLAAAAALNGGGSGDRVGPVPLLPRPHHSLPPSAPFHSGPCGMIATVELGDDRTGQDMLPANIALGPWSLPVSPAQSAAWPAGPPPPQMMPTWRGHMDPPGAPPATDPRPAPTSPQLQPRDPPGPPLVTFGKQRPSPQRAHRIPPPPSAGVPLPNLPAWSQQHNQSSDSMQPWSPGLTNPAEMDEEPQPFGMPLPSMQTADEPATTAFGLTVQLPAPADKVGPDMDDYAAPFPPPEADMAPTPSTHPSAPLLPNTDGPRENINLHVAAARGIVSHGNNATDGEATHAWESLAVEDLENCRPPMKGG
mmetsp:Transcript_70994/g.141004  ORF Transcript_70994/g.141004 Transcript_70994/m.141004 type:complete len:1027 (-) Transcript_70994:221-3301(-)